MGTVFVYVIALLTSIGAFLNGYAIGSVNGLQNYVGFLETLHLLGPTLNTSVTVNNYSNSSDSEGDECNQPSELSAESRLILGAMVAGVSIGGALANLISGKPADLFGRKPMLLFSAVLTIVGGAIQTASFFSWMFVIGRVISGCAFGTIYTAGPVYIAEMSSKKVRGRTLALLGLAVAIGILTGYVASFLFNGVTNGWRISQSVLCIVGLIYFIAIVFLPRSPRWLVLHNKEEKAVKVLKKTLPQKDFDSIPTEIESIKKSVSVEKRSLKNELKLIMNWRVIKRILLGGLLQALAALAGTYIYFFSETLFCSFGVIPFVTLFVVGALTLFGTVITPFIVDKVGRKCLLISGGLIMAALNAVTGSLILGFNLEEVENQVVGYIVVCLVCIFVLIYSATWYPVPYVITGEMFPLEVRAVGNGVSVFCFYATTAVISQLFPYTFTLLRSYATLYVVGCVDLVAVFCCLFFFPETKGVSLEDMDMLFKKSCFVGCTRLNFFNFFNSKNDETCDYGPDQLVDTKMVTIASVNPLAELITEPKRQAVGDHNTMTSKSTHVSYYDFT